jgi:hypothetical protein
MKGSDPLPPNSSYNSAPVDSDVAAHQTGIFILGIPAQKKHATDSHR